LKKLALQSNRLLSMAGLHHCTALEELYLSHNGIRCIQASPGTLPAVTALKTRNLFCGGSGGFAGGFDGGGGLHGRCLDGAKYAEYTYMFGDPFLVQLRQKTYGHSVKDVFGKVCRVYVFQVLRTAGYR